MYKSSPMYKVMMQYAHHSHNECEFIKEAQGDDCLHCFDNIDWAEQALKACEERKVTPTLAFESDENDDLIWFSVVGDDKTIKFVSECSLEGQIPKVFGLIKQHGKVSLDSPELSSDDVREALRLFMKKDVRGLNEIYRKPRVAAEKSEIVAH